MKEIELSFVFDLSKAPVLDGGELITDYYINQNLRLRKYCSNLFLTSKSGDKSSGVREEHETKLCFDKNIEDTFKAQSKLIVHKRRVSIGGYTVDYVESPIKIGIVEKEFSNIDELNKFSKDHPKLINCPLNAWNYNKRKIGFAGPPSSGKTSVAKQISLNLNNNYSANSSDVVEYATSFIQKRGRIPSFNDQVLLFIKQKGREQSIFSTTNLVLSDCPAWISYIYAVRALRTMKSSNETDFIISSLYKMAVESLSDYETIFLLKIIEYKENNVRYHSYDLSLEIQKEIKDFLQSHGRKFTEITYNDIDSAIDGILYFNNIEDILSLDIFK